MPVYKSESEERNRDQNILIVDDDELILKTISRILESSNQNFFIHTSKNVVTTLELVKKTYWDTILLDLSIPYNDDSQPDSKNGLFILDFLNKELKLNTPVIAITGHNDDELSEIVLDKGAYYFLNKPLRPKSLLAIVKNATRFQMSGFDGLTGLLNRKTFEERLNSEFERVKRKNQELEIQRSKGRGENLSVSYLSLIFFDGDNFKEINDTYNHLMGDQVLKKIGRSFVDESVYTLLNGSESGNYLIRPYDIAARFGGDEFTIYLPETDHQSSCIVAKRIRSSIKSFDLSDLVDPVNRNSAISSISLSIGIATYPFPNNVKDHLELIHKADDAMYASKIKRSGIIFGYDGKGELMKLG